MTTVLILESEGVEIVRQTKRRTRPEMLYLIIFHDLNIYKHPQYLITSPSPGFEFWVCKSEFLINDYFKKFGWVNPNFLPSNSIFRQ